MVFRWTFLCVFRVWRIVLLRQIAFDGFVCTFKDECWMLSFSHLHTNTYLFYWKLLFYPLICCVWVDCHFKTKDWSNLKIYPHTSINLRIRSYRFFCNCEMLLWTSGSSFWVFYYCKNNDINQGNSSENNLC